jgi:hypothetical protein
LEIDLGDPDHKQRNPRNKQHDPNQGEKQQRRLPSLFKARILRKQLLAEF